MSFGSTVKEQVHIHITAEHNLFDLKLNEVWAYRDLIVLYTRRTIVTFYKQTVLGPLWLIINPLMTSVVYQVVFGKIAGFTTDGAPQLLFYLMGNATWSLFSTVITQSSDAFVANANLYGKVYFPRLVVPISNALVALFQFFIQFVLGMIVGLYCMGTSDFSLTFSHWVFIPALLVLIVALGMGFGIIASSMTTRYRDLRVLVSYGVRLWMYVTPVVYPMTQFSQGALRTAITLNPMTAPMEAMRWCLWGSPAPAPLELAYSVLVASVILLFGIMIFNKVERTFMDTV